MRAAQQRMPVTFERDQDVIPSPSSAGSDDERLCDRFTGAYSRGVARCALSCQHPRLRLHFQNETTVLLFGVGVR